MAFKNELIFVASFKSMFLDKKLGTFPRMRIFMGDGIGRLLVDNIR